MTVIFIIIFGAVVGLIAFKVRGSGFGLWWDIYLGVAGSAFASSIMMLGYLVNVVPRQSVIGINFYSSIIGITGAIALIYAVWFYRHLRVVL